MSPTPRLTGLPPVTSDTPRVLVLGSFPSCQSLLWSEYYANPKNRFWQLMEAIFMIPLSLPYGERIQLLGERGIALWDVIGSCEREGSGDAAICEPAVNDIPGFLDSHPSVSLIIMNGQTAGHLFHKHLRTGISPEIKDKTLLSTSPANARFTLPKLIDAWSALMEFRGK